MLIILPALSFLIPAILSLFFIAAIHKVLVGRPTDPTAAATADYCTARSYGLVIGVSTGTDMIA